MVKQIVCVHSTHRLHPSPSSRRVVPCRACCAVRWWVIRSPVLPVASTRVPGGGAFTKFFTNKNAAEAHADQPCASVLDSELCAVPAARGAWAHRRRWEACVAWL